jgi:hypothetical protein
MSAAPTAAELAISHFAASRMRWLAIAIGSGGVSSAVVKPPAP